jgi:uncharacterized Ntn-hydrolase superfamily protein
MTFSFVVALPGQQLLGVATASCSLAVGHSVPAVLPGVGAVVSQSWTNPALRGLGLAALERGASPASYLAGLAGLDPDHTWRQVGLVDAAGAAAAHTGPDCSGWAGHRLATVPDGTALGLGNLVVGPEVVEAGLGAITTSLDTVASATGLAELLVAALAAGQARGGDRRGQQSAAVVVGHGPRQPQQPADLEVDLRVDDAEQPVVELARLVGVRVRTGGLPLRPRTA